MFKLFLVDLPKAHIDNHPSKLKILCDILHHIFRKHFHNAHIVQQYHQQIGGLMEHKSLWSDAQRLHGANVGVDDDTLADDDVQADDEVASCRLPAGVYY